MDQQEAELNVQFASASSARQHQEADHVASIVLRSELGGDQHTISLPSRKDKLHQGG